MEQSKTCTQCRQIKPLTDFHTASDSKDGYRANCKECKRSRRSKYRMANHELVLQKEADYREANRPAINANKTARYAANPEKHRQQARANYNPATQKKRSTIYRANNPQRIIDNNLRYRQNNPEKVKAEAKKWRALNKVKLANYANERRAMMNANGVFRISKKELTKLYSSPRCFYCRELTDEIQMDHVIPIKRGGTHSIGNLVPACSGCNQSKINKTITEWNKWKTATLNKS